MAYALPALPYRNGFIAAAWACVRASMQRKPRASGRLEAKVQPVQPPRLAAADQWAKLSDILGRAVGGAAAAEHLQSAATRQLDLAQYGLTTLVDELSSVMTIPGRKSRTATLHVLGAGHDAMAETSFKPRAGQALAA